MSYYIFPNAVSKDDCKMYLDYCLKNLSFDEAGTIKHGFSSDGSDDIEVSEARKTSVAFLDQVNHDFINKMIYSFIREANQRFFHYNITRSQEVQFAKYEIGDYYNWHQDSSFNSKFDTMRKLSLTMSLTDNESYDGGHLQFFNNGVVNPDWPEIDEDIKSVGSVVVFDSQDWHRVTPVTRGVRYSLVCWTVGPNFI